MTSKERVLSSLRHVEPDRVPIDLGAGTTGIEVEAYDGLKRLLGHAGQTRTFVRDHVEVDEPLLQRFGIDTRYVRVGAPRGFRVQIDADNSYVDIWGVRWQKPPSSLYWDMVGHPIPEPTLEALKAYRWPDPHDPGRTDGLRARAQALAEQGAYAVVLDNTGFGAFEQGWALRGFENFYTDLVAEPAFAEALMEGVADYQIALYEHVLAEVGPYVDVVMVAEDLGSQDGPLISPDTYRRMIKPVQRAHLAVHQAQDRSAALPAQLRVGATVHPGPDRAGAWTS